MRVVLFALFSLVNSFTFADNKIETIQLNYRLASEVLTEIQAFIPKEATARASNNFIILQATPPVIAEIKNLINKLDVPPQNLMVSVLKTDTALSDKQRHLSDSHILVNENGMTAQASLSEWSTNNTRNKDQRYQARGIAGQAIMLTTGQALPQKEHSLFLSANGNLGIQTKTKYIDIKNGFQAIANILPNHQVSIQIYPQFATFSKRHGVIDRSQLFSSISGPVGIWLKIGQVSSDKNTQQLGVTHYQTHHQRAQFIYIKIDEIISH